MTSFRSISPGEFTTKPVELFGSDWPLLCAGTKDDFNSMTIGWGAVGQIWGMPYTSVYVRPTRYTHEFMDKYEYFSIVVFDRSFKESLATFGTESGRDIDKMNFPGLTPDFSYNAPVFHEANLILICKKMYRQEIDKDLLISEYKTKVIEEFYSKGVSYNNFHTIYYGEITNILSVKMYNGTGSLYTF